MRATVHSRPARWGLSVLALLVALAALAGVVRLWAGRIDPATISQSELHEIATTSEHFVMSPRPRERVVVIRKVTSAEVARVLRSYMPPRFGPGPAAAISGSFDPETGEIHITGRVPRIQASLPAPWLQGSFRHALRHEYGHALLDEWLADETGVDWTDRATTFLREEGEIFDASDFTQDESGVPSVVPRELRPLVREYLAVRPRLYGSEYYTSTFDEYFAESYSRFLLRRSVPVEMRRFLAQFAQPKPLGGQ